MQKQNQKRRNGSEVYNSPIFYHAEEDCFTDANDHLLGADLAEHLNTVTAELTALREFVASLNSLAFEEWYGSHKTIDGKFTIFDSDGNGVASGDDALDAITDFKEQK